MTLQLTENDGEVAFRVTARPGARRDEVVGELNGALKVAVRSAPDKGKANEAIRKLLAKCMGARASQIRIISGHSARNKTLLIPSELKSQLIQLA